MSGPLTDLLDRWEAEAAALHAAQVAAFAEHNAAVAARDLPFCWHRWHDARRVPHECMQARPCPDHTPEPAPAPLPRFIVFAGISHDERGGADDVLDPGPSAFQHVADAADAAEAAVAPSGKPTITDPNGTRTRYDWSQVAEVTHAGLTSVGEWERP